jgi:uncharacterized membrane protein
MPYPTPKELLGGKMAGFAAMGLLAATIVRAGNQEWGWTALMVLPTLGFGWLAYTFLRDD